MKIGNLVKEIDLKVAPHSSLKKKEANEPFAIATLEHSGSSSATEDETVDDMKMKAGPSKKVEKEKVLNGDLSTTLDRSKISDGAALMVIGQTVKSLETPIDSITVKFQEIL